MPFKDPEKKREYMREYDRKRNATPEHKEYMRAYMREYDRKRRATPEHKEYMRKWLLANPQYKKDCSWISHMLLKRAESGDFR